MSLTHDASSLRSELYAGWARLLDTILPPQNEDRLVPVAEVSAGALHLVEGSLADVGVTPTVTEERSMFGVSHYRVLVPARDAKLAKEACVYC